VAIAFEKQRLMTGSFDDFALRYPREELKCGFDYETVPQITLKSIARNRDIDMIYNENHPKIMAALTPINAVLTTAIPTPFRPTQGGRKGNPVSSSGRSAHTNSEGNTKPPDWDRLLISCREW